jgi:soluble P-type ATPase
MATVDHPSFFTILMIEIDIPDFGGLQLAHLVLDYNGTIAVDGRLIPGVAERLTVLAELLTIHVVTADTFGSASEQLAELPVTMHLLPPGSQDLAKLEYIEKLGAAHTVCIGNGRNDVKMLDSAALGIAVVQLEGAATAALLAADVVTTDIVDALDLLTNPLRLTATLRS